MTDITAGTSVPRRIDHGEARDLAIATDTRFLALLEELDPDDWHRPTDCDRWTVKDIAAHVLGMMETTISMREWGRQYRLGRRVGRAIGGSWLDGMNEVQVRERADWSPERILAELAERGPIEAATRTSLPAPLRRVPLRVPGGEWIRMGHLQDVILTRDAWMHRVDVARATGRQVALDADQDGRIVADVVAEWADNHGQPYRLSLTGPAGASYASCDAGAKDELDAVEFCRIVSGRAPGTGLLTTPVLF